MRFVGTDDGFAMPHPACVDGLPDLEKCAIIKGDTTGKAITSFPALTETKTNGTSAKERKMKVQVIYSSLTGCTKKVATAIFNGIEVEQKTIHDLKDGAPVLDGDVILLGYWGISGNPNDEMKEFLQTIQGKAVGIFCTLGYYADSAHARQTVEAGLDLLKERNEVIGCFVCNGAVSQSLIDGQGKGGIHTPTEQKEIRWEIIKSHPTAAECALAAERFNERITLYRRCKELKIDFQSVL